MTQTRFRKSLAKVKNVILSLKPAKGLLAGRFCTDCKCFWQMALREQPSLSRENILQELHLNAKLNVLLSQNVLANVDLEHKSTLKKLDLD